MAKEEEISENLLKVIRGLNKIETEDKTSVSEIKTKITFKESLFILYIFHKKFMDKKFFIFSILKYKTLKRQDLAIAPKRVKSLMTLTKKKKFEKTRKCHHLEKAGSQKSEIKFNFTVFVKRS